MGPMATTNNPCWEVHPWGCYCELLLAISLVFSSMKTKCAYFGALADKRSMRAEVDHHDHTQTLSMYLFAILLVFHDPEVPGGCSV